MMEPENVSDEDDWVYLRQNYTFRFVSRQDWARTRQAHDEWWDHPVESDTLAAMQVIDSERNLKMQAVYWRGQPPQYLLSNDEDIIKEIPKCPDCGTPCVVGDVAGEIGGTWFCRSCCEYPVFQTSPEDDPVPEEVRDRLRSEEPDFNPPKRK